MSRNLFLSLVTISLSGLVCLDANAVDRVFEKSGTTTNGQIEKISTKGIQIKKSGKLVAIPASDVLKVQFDDDPKELTEARDFAVKEQYDQALAELKNVDFGSIKEPGVLADAMYYTAFCQSKMALAGKSSPATAAKTMLSFVSKNRESWHFFDAAKVLGDLALATGDAKRAKQYYGSLAKSPSTEMKIQSVYLTGLVHLKAKENDAAVAQFDKLLKQKFDSTEAIRTQLLAKASKAVALTQKGEVENGDTLISQLESQINNNDIEMSAKFYNAKGAINEAKGDDVGAILSYLHTHLQYSSQPDAHAEALKRLAELFPKVGKPERAAEFQQELQERYPGLM